MNRLLRLLERVGTHDKLKSEEIIPDFKKAQKKLTDCVDAFTSTLEKLKLEQINNLNLKDTDKT